MCTRSAKGTKKITLAKTKERKALYTFSIAASSGITTWHVHPNAGATVARLMAVLPALPSVTTPPSASAPDSKAYTNKNSTLSLTLPPGFKNSAFPRICLSIETVLAEEVRDNYSYGERCDNRTGGGSHRRRRWRAEVEVDPPWLNRLKIQCIFKYRLKPVKENGGKAFWFYALQSVEKIESYCSSGLSNGKEVVTLKRESHARRLDVLLRVLLIVQQLLQENRHGSKRDIYYMHPSIFKAVGLYFLNYYKDIISVAQYILVVEKESVFQRLANDQFCKRNRCIVISIGILSIIWILDRFLRLLTEKLRLPAYCLVDCDPYGFDILATYRFGSMQMAYDAKFLSVPEIKWLGAFPLDCDNYCIPQQCLLPLTKEVAIGHHQSSIVSCPIACSHHTKPFSPSLDSIVVSAALPRFGSL
nr:meiotic recombination protein SPO11-1 isoform X3 [Ipomoea trifida]